MSELSKRPTDSGLAIRSDQERFSEMQVAALKQIGVTKATQGDLDVFFHVAKRTGLDPFARQIYLVGRQERQQSGGYATKYTIQTGIDGYRLIGRRAADKTGETVSVEAPEWAHEDGSWRQLWAYSWGAPLAARVTIRRAGQPFTAVAMFDEYKQTKSDGTLTMMWQQRPAGQIAKCAESLAWRLAFPQDLSGLYTDDEMHHVGVHAAPVSVSAGRAAVAEALGSPVTVVEDRGRVMVELMNSAGLIERGARLAYVEKVIGRQIESAGELIPAEIDAIITALEGEV